MPVAKYFSAHFLKKTKRFFEPVFTSKKNLAIHIFLHVVYEVGKIIPMILLILSQHSGNIRGILYVSIIYVLFGGILTQTLRKHYWLIPAYSYMSHITKKYISHLIKKDNLHYESVGTGRIISIVERGINMWHILLTNISIFIINTIIVGGFVFLRMTMIDWKYGAGALCLMILIIFWILWINSKALIWKRALKEEESNYTRKLVKIFMSKFETLQNKKIHAEIHDLDQGIQKQLDIASHRNVYLAYMYDIPYFVFLAIIVGIFSLNYYEMVTLHHGFLIELIGIALLAQSMLLPYIDFIKDFSKEFMHVEKLWDFMDTTPEIQGYDIGEEFSFRQGNYELRNVSFEYREGLPVLRNFSLTIHSGRKTALVGRSGSGKTTLMKLLAGYMRPVGGELLIDGQNIVDIRLDSYYAHIGYLTQEPSVFDGTVEENLFFGIKGKPTDRDLEKAIELAECEFIYELEHGIKTEIGERGVRLSGGQKQRLAIAKIFLKNPEIILLDEPTAALDSYSEKKVARAFEHLFEGRTVIVIAHRLQTVKEADDIIVIEKGKIVERGTHNELLKLGGSYSGMVDLQSGVVREENNEEMYE